jgi:spermidine synthase
LDLHHRVKEGLRAASGALALLLVSCALLAPSSPTRAENLIDLDIRAAMLKRKDGLITRTETVYNDIFVAKHQNLLTMTFQWKGYFFQESKINLADPDDLPMLYGRAMTIAAIYPPDVKRVLMLGLGGGGLSTYLGRFLPDATIDSVELDPGVIDAAKKYFGIRETSKSRLIESDGRVFLNRHSEPYDLIEIDAFTGSYIPFHLMTKEFYRLVRDRLTPHGVAAFNIIPGTKLFDSNLRTLKSVFDRLDLYQSNDEAAGGRSVIVMAPRDPADAENLKDKAAAAQERYKFKFDVAKLATDWRIELPKELKGDELTDDFAPVNVYDAYGRRYKKKN